MLAFIQIAARLPDTACRALLYLFHRKLVSFEALGYGLLLGAVAVGTKLVTGAWEWESKWAVGWAMVGRGELGFVMVSWLRFLPGLHLK